MATAASRKCCLVCGKEKATYKCDGCLKSYCKNHLQDHQKELELQLDEIENGRNIFRQTLSEQVKQPNIQSLIQEVNEWERCSIRKIQQTAEDNRQLILKQTQERFEMIEAGLKHLTDEIKETRQDNEFNELNLNDLKHKLEKLQRQLNNSANISLKEDTASSFIKRIYVNSTHRELVDLEAVSIPITLKWNRNAITIAGGNGAGGKLDQLNHPWGIHIDTDKTIYIADGKNHRIVAWTKNATCGQIVAGGNGEGNGNHQLSYPSKVIIDEENDSLIIADQGNKRVVRWPRHNGRCGQTIMKDIQCFDLVTHKNEYLYICDNEKQEVRRWKIGENQGVLVAGGNGCGSALNQFNTPQFIYIDQNHTIYVSDFGNHRIMKWTKGAKEGIVVAGGQGEGKSLKQLSGPQGIFVDKLGTLYIADGRNNRILRWIKDAKEGSIIAGGNNDGSQPNQFNRCIGLSFDDENNLYVADLNNCRIQKYLVDNRK